MAEERMNNSAEERREVLFPKALYSLIQKVWKVLSEGSIMMRMESPDMGHRDIATTMDVYAEATDTKKKESFETLSHMDIF